MPGRGRNGLSYSTAMSEATGKIVSEAIKKGYRGFLARIHPDYFMGDVKAQRTNQLLIQQFERPLESLLQSWLTETSVRLSDRSSVVDYFIRSKDSKNAVLRKWPLSFSLQEPVIDNPKPLFKLVATQSLLGLFQDANVSIESEIGRYLSREITSRISDENDFEKGKFGEYLDDELRVAQLRQQPLMTAAIPRIAKMEFIRLDTLLSKEEKADAMVSLCRCVDELEEAEVRFGLKMPVVFISHSPETPTMTRDSIKLPPRFTPSDLQLYLDWWERTMSD